MLIIYGRKKYGKTDHLPGLFFVMTEFWHLYYYPIIPVKSWCILDRDNREHGVPIRMSGKSVLVAYLRAILVWTSGILTIFFIVMFGILFDNGNQEAWGAILLLGVVVVVGWTLVFMSYCWTKPNSTRALELAKHFSISMEHLIKHYANDSRVVMLKNASNGVTIENVYSENYKNSND